MTPFFIVFMLFAGGMALLRYLQRSEQHWKDAARMLGIEYDSQSLFGPTAIDGYVDGVHVRVERIQNQNEHSTQYRLRYPELDVTFRLQPKGVITAIKEVFGAKDISLGDPVFDAAFHVTASDPAAVRRFFNARRRERVLRVLTRYENTSMTAVRLEAKSKGRAQNAGVIVSSVRTFVRLVETLYARETVVRPPDFEWDTSQQDDVQAYATSLPVPEEPPPLPEGTAETAPSTAPPPLPASPAAEVPVSPARSDAAAADAVERSASDSPGPLTDPLADKGGGPAAPVTLELVVVSALCAEVFGSGLSHMDSERTFDESYKGRGVRWSGTLERLDEFYSDRVFGSEPGAKATLSVNDTGMDLPVRAIVHVTREAGDLLRGHEGEPVEFAGALVHCDAFQRHLMIGDGAVRMS